MNEFVRIEKIENVFNEMHGVKPQVYQRRLNNNSYQTRLDYNNKSILLQEDMERGMTKLALMTYNGNTTNFKSIYEAEVEASRIFKE